MLPFGPGQPIAPGDPESPVKMFKMDGGRTPVDCV